MKTKRLFRLLTALSFLLAILPVQAAQAAAPADMLQFTAGGHALGFAAGGMYAATGTHALHVEFVDANSVQPQSDTPASKQGQAAALSRIIYTNLWNGITLTYTAGTGNVYSTTYTLAPGADPGEIRLRYNAPLTLNEDGTLGIAFETGRMTESAPIAWQEIQGQRVPVDVSFQVSGHEVSFTLGPYDQHFTLTIDPHLVWNTFLGGSGEDAGYGIAADGSGNIYVAGYSNAYWGSPVRGHSGTMDAFVTKFDSNCVQVWNTFLGGTGEDKGYGIALDLSGNVYVTGFSDADWGSPVRAYAGGDDAFAAKLDSAGSLTWSTFLGGSGVDETYSIVVDGSGNVYVTGYSDATWGNPVRAYSGGSSDAFAAKLDSAGSLTWNTFLGGSEYDIGTSIAIDGSGNVYVTGYSSTAWGSPVRAYTGGYDGFAVKLNSAGSLTWNTFLGGSDNDYGTGLAVDGSVNVYVSGFSASTWGSPVRDYTGNDDAFAARLDSSGNLTWNTFLGGSLNDIGTGVAVDGSGNVYVSGFGSTTWGSPVRAYTGGEDAFAAKLNSAGSLTWSTFLGGSEVDYGNGIAVDGSGDIYVAGSSTATWGAPYRYYNGGQDAVFTRLDSNGMLIFHAFLGGLGSETANGIAVDGSGNVYIIGNSTLPWGSPVNAFNGGNSDAYVAKLDSAGNLIWSTFLGGIGMDYGYGVAVDGSGNVYAAGTSYTSWGSPIRAYTGDADAFAAKLDSTGVLTWNTFQGGSGGDDANGIAVDGSGTVYVTGVGRAAWGNPVRAYSGSNDVFAAKLDSAGNLVWNTFLGTSGIEFGNGIAVDGSGNTYVTGYGYATWGTPVRAFSGSTDAFVAKLDSAGNLTWNTFLGGSGYDYGFGIAVDGSGNVYVAGYSNAAWGDPVRAYTGSVDTFAAQLDSSGNLAWNTFLGGSGYDFGFGIAVDGNGNVYVTGQSYTTWGNPVRAFSSGTDAFAAKLDSSGTLSVNTFLGGSGNDTGRGIAVDGNGFIFVAGTAGAAWGSPVRAFTSGNDAFAAKMDFSPPGAFFKASPANASYAFTNPTLSWSASSGANEYEYCYDTINNAVCDTSWISAGTSTSAGLSGLSNHTTYYWQVRASNAGGTTVADGGAWWSFTARNQTFADVPIDHPLWQYIEAFYNAGITTGCGVSPLIYCPEQPVTRASMAVFLLRAKYGSGYTPPAATHTFADLPVAGKEWQEAWVDQFYLEGITSGCGTGPLIYCPENSTTRAAMAVFILRALYGSSYTPPAASHFFSDLPVAGKEWMEPWVDELYREGITTGCGTGPLIYCPENPVKRQAMAAFIVRAFSLPLP